VATSILEEEEEEEEEDVLLLDGLATNLEVKAQNW
jgi:hypothetical protein